MAERAATNREMNRDLPSMVACVPLAELDGVAIVSEGPCGELLGSGPYLGQYGTCTDGQERSVIRADERAYNTRRYRRVRTG